MRFNPAATKFRRALVLCRGESLLIAPVFSHACRANKAPEPTTMAVTPRAIARISEMKTQTPIRHAARGAPATVVAHL